MVVSSPAAELLVVRSVSLFQQREMPGAMSLCFVLIICLVAVPGALCSKALFSDSGLDGREPTSVDFSTLDNWQRFEADLRQRCQVDCRESTKEARSELCCSYAGLVNVHTAKRTARWAEDSDRWCSLQAASTCRLRIAHLTQVDASQSDAPVEARLVLHPGSEPARLFDRDVVHAPVKGWLLRSPSSSPEPADPHLRLPSTGPGPADPHLRLPSTSPESHPQFVFVVDPRFVPGGCQTASAAEASSNACTIPGLPLPPVPPADVARVWRQELLRAAVRAQGRSQLQFSSSSPLGAAAGRSPLQQSRESMRMHRDRIDADAAANADVTDDGVSRGLFDAAINGDAHDILDRGRSLYMKPQLTRGLRNILVARFRYYLQGDADVLSDADTNTLVSQSLSHLNNLSLGAATWTYTLPLRVYSFPSTMGTCSSTLSTMQTQAKAALIAKGVDPTQYAATLVLLPQCGTGQEEGVGSLNSLMAFLFAANLGAHRALLSILSFSLGMQTADYVDAITGTYTAGGNELDSAGLGDLSGSRTWNGFAGRAFHSGYAVDAGWVPEDRLVTLGASSDYGDSAGGASLLLGGVAAGSLARNAGSPLSVRIRANPSFSAAAGDYYYYLTYRQNSPHANGSLSIDYTPHHFEFAGASYAIDTSPGTDGFLDTSLATGQAFLLPAAADGSRYLLENAAVVQTVQGSSDAADNSLALRVRPILAATRATDEGLGCFGVSCQPGLNWTSVTLPCVTNPSASTTVPVPVTDLDFPSVFRVNVSDLSARASSIPQAAVSARLCLPASMVGRVSIALAAFQGAPLAEILTSSPIDRGSALATGEPFWNESSRTMDYSCLNTSFYVNDDAAFYVAARALSLRGFYNSSADAPAPLSLQLFCPPPASGAVANAFGMPIAGLWHNHRYAFIWQSSSGSTPLWQSGVYVIDPSRPTLNGKPIYTRPGMLSVYWKSGYWYLSPYDDFTRYYSLAADASGDLLSLAGSAWTSYFLKVNRACPPNSFYHRPTTGCLPCPVGATSRGGTSTDLTVNQLNDVCVCGPGTYFDSTRDGTGRFTCRPCTAGTYKPLPGISVNDCIYCPVGWTSAAGSVSCTPVAAVGGREYPLCPRYSIANWSPSSYNGVYALQTNGTSSSTTRDGLGEGRVTWIREDGAMALLWVPGIQYWQFSASRFTDSPNNMVGSQRTPQYWAANIELPSGSAVLIRCLCAAYGTVGRENCACGSGQTLDVASGTCVDAVQLPCTAGYRLAGDGFTCIDIDECAANNGGCSHGCANSDGSYACTCPAGWGLNATTRRQCAPCSDDQFVDAARGGICSPCSPLAGLTFGARRTAAGGACGCPHGFIAADGGECSPPVELVLSAPSAGLQAVSGITGTSLPIAASPFFGRYVACAPAAASGALASDATLAPRMWQLAEPAAGLLPAPNTIYLVYSPANATGLATAATGTAPGARFISSTAARPGGMWSITAGSYATVDAAPVNRYAYAWSADVTPLSEWPTSVVSSSGSTIATTTVGGLPVGLQQWRVWTPWPAAFSSVASLRVDVASQAMPPVSQLPTCGTLAPGARISGLRGVVTLGSGAANVYALPDVSPSVTSTTTATPSPTSSVTASLTITPSVAASTTPSTSVSPSVSPTASSSRSVAATASATVSASRSASGSLTPSRAASVSISPSRAPSISTSPTRSPSQTRSPSVTPTVESSPSVSSSEAASSSPSGSVSVTASASQSASASASMSESESLSPSVSSTPAETPSWSPSGSVSASPSRSASGSASLSPTPSASQTLSLSMTASATGSRTGSVSATTSPSRSPSVSSSATATSSVEASPSVTPSVSVTTGLSVSPSPSVAASTSISPSVSGSTTASPSISPSGTASASLTPSETVSHSVSPSVAASRSLSASLTGSRSASETASGSVTASPSQSRSASLSPSISGSVTASQSGTGSHSASRTVSESSSPSRSGSSTTSATVSASGSGSESLSVSASGSGSVSLTASATPSLSTSRTATASASLSTSRSHTTSASVSASVSPSLSASITASPSASETTSVSGSASPSPSASPSAVSVSITTTRSSTRTAVPSRTSTVLVSASPVSSASAPITAIVSVQFSLVISFTPVTAPDSLLTTTATLCTSAGAVLNRLIVAELPESSTTCVRGEPVGDASSSAVAGLRLLYAQAGDSVHGSLAAGSARIPCDPLTSRLTCALVGVALSLQLLQPSVIGDAAAAYRLRAEPPGSAIVLPVSVVQAQLAAVQASLASPGFLLSAVRSEAAVRAPNAPVGDLLQSASISAPTGFAVAASVPMPPSPSPRAGATQPNAGGAGGVPIAAVGGAIGGTVLLVAVAIFFAVRHTRRAAQAKMAASAGAAPDGTDGGDMLGEGEGAGARRAPGSASAAVPDWLAAATAPAVPAHSLAAPTGHAHVLLQNAKYPHQHQQHNANSLGECGRSAAGAGSAAVIIDAGGDSAVETSVVSVLDDSPHAAWQATWAGGSGSGSAGAGGSRGGMDGRVADPADDGDGAAELGEDDEQLDAAAAAAAAAAVGGWSPGGAAAAAARRLIAGSASSSGPLDPSRLFAGKQRAAPSPLAQGAVVPPASKAEAAAGAAVPVSGLDRRARGNSPGAGAAFSRRSGSVVVGAVRLPPAPPPPGPLPLLQAPPVASVLSVASPGRRGSGRLTPSGAGGGSGRLTPGGAAGGSGRASPANATAHAGGGSGRASPSAGALATTGGVRSSPSLGGVMDFESAGVDSRSGRPRTPDFGPSLLRERSRTPELSVQVQRSSSGRNLLLDSGAQPSSSPSAAGSLRASSVRSLLEAPADVAVAESGRSIAGLRSASGRSLLEAPDDASSAADVHQSKFGLRSRSLASATGSSAGAAILLPSVSPLDAMARASLLAAVSSGSSSHNTPAAELARLGSLAMQISSRSSAGGSTRRSFSAGDEGVLAGGAGMAVDSPRVVVSGSSSRNDETCGASSRPDDAPPVPVLTVSLVNPSGRPGQHGQLLCTTSSGSGVSGGGGRGSPHRNSSGRSSPTHGGVASPSRIASQHQLHALSVVRGSSRRPSASSIPSAPGSAPGSPKPLLCDAEDDDGAVDGNDHSDEATQADGDDAGDAHAGSSGGRFAGAPPRLSLAPLHLGDGSAVRRRSASPGSAQVAASASASSLVALVAPAAVLSGHQVAASSTQHALVAQHAQPSFAGSRSGAGSPSRLSRRGSSIGLGAGHPAALGGAAGGAGAGADAAQRSRSGSITAAGAVSTSVAAMRDHGSGAESPRRAESPPLLTASLLAPLAHIELSAPPAPPPAPPPALLPFAGRAAGAANRFADSGSASILPVPSGFLPAAAFASASSSSSTPSISGVRTRPRSPPRPPSLRKDHHD